MSSLTINCLHYTQKIQYKGKKLYFGTQVMESTNIIILYV